MKKASTWVLVLLVIASVSVQANAEGLAAEESTRASTIGTSLIYDGTTAYCEVTVIAPNKSIRVSISLREGNTLIASWYESGTSSLSISKSTTVVSGHTYTMYVNVTIDGTPVYVPSTTKTCP